MTEPASAACAPVISASSAPACARAAVTAWGVKSPLVAGSGFSVSARAKSLDGAPVIDASMCVMDEDGRVVAQVRSEDGAVADMAATISLTAPVQTGPHGWTVALRSGERVLARRPLPFSVTPDLTRGARVAVRDAQTGEPLADASAFFYMRGLMRTKPLCYVSDAAGVVNARIAPGAIYDVRVEALGHDEGYCRLEAGDISEPASGLATLKASALDDDRLVTRGRVL